MQSNPEYLLTKGQLIYCRSKWKAVEADKCQLSSGQGEPDDNLPGDNHGSRYNLL